MKLYFLYIVLIGVVGQVSSGILWADLLLPIVVYNVYLHHKLIPKKVFFFGLILLFYTVLVGLISILIGKNSSFFVFALSMRTGSFILLVFWGIILAHKFNNNNYFNFPIFIVLSVSAFVTIKNYSLGERAYYGYGQIASWSAPAISGFLLGVLALFLIIRGLNKNLKSNYSLLFGGVGVILTFLTFSISGNVSLIGSIIVYLLLVYFISNNHSNKIKIKVGIILLGLSSIIITNLNILLDNFSRILRIFDKLDYRVEKVSSLSNELCTQFYCTVFGIGPGGHSFFNGNALGEGSILAFDQLYGRILLEWGIIGSLIWILFILSLGFVKIRKNKIIFNIEAIPLLAYGVAFGIGSEFIFVAFSGSVYALLLGFVTGLGLLKYR